MTVPDPENFEPALFESTLTSLPLLTRGKVRDIYAIGHDHLLLVATDRLSAFDVVLPDPIPGKGVVLTAMSNFWFARFRNLVRNHLAPLALEEALEDVLDPAERSQVAGRAVVVRRLQPLLVEAVVRGYLIGSGWKEYQQTGAVCGIALPPGLRQADKLPVPIFTPATKAEAGSHDQNIDYATAARIVGEAHAAQMKSLALMLYGEGARYALSRGILIADTKFEFGTDPQGNVVLIDEALTPDSSRFWPLSDYQPGDSPPSFDKQFVRDYLETLTWDKRPPGPRLPPRIIAQTAAKYREALSLLAAR